MNNNKFSIIFFIIFFVIFSKQIFAYQQDIVNKYDNIFSSKVLSDEDEILSPVLEYSDTLFDETIS